MSRARGFSVRIFMPDGEPEGLRIIEKSNWTGLGIVFPRSLFVEVRQRSELKGTGVYLVWGPDDSGQLPRVYCGEGDNVVVRLDQHAKSKDFWTHAAVFTSKDENLNKAHVKYIEARLVGLALAAKRCELDNGNSPQAPLLSEADGADAEAFLSDLLLCLPIVGVNLFQQPRTTDPKAGNLFLRAKGIEASGVDGAEGFVVHAGSTAVKAEVPSIHAYLSDLRGMLLDKGVFEDSGDVLRLALDYVFNSPSTAAGVLLGRAANGRIEWKDFKGRTLKELQQLTAEA